MARLGDDGVDLPFERQQPTDLVDEFLLSGGVVCAAATVPVPEIGIRPALMFRFAKADGTGFHHPILLLLEADQAESLVRLVRDSVDAACEAAGAA